jgi:hypothetical protein
MCDKSRKVSLVLLDLMACVPNEERKACLNKIIERSFYTAPEACGLLWVDIYKALMREHNTGESYQEKMCQIYNDGYKAYKKEFSE